MLTYRSSTVLLMLLQQLYCWEVSPSIPSGHRSQFLVLQNDGTYKYGYDTGDGIAAKQSGDPANQVSGYYSYKAPLGGDINLKYTSGVQGFMPETLSTTGSISQFTTQNEDQSKTGDASYSFSFDTPTYRRTETSDRFGNIKGSYLYIDETGMHDLSFIAGEKTGFLPTSGSLSKPNGLTIDQLARLPLFRTIGSTDEFPVTAPTTDLSSTEPVTNTDEESTDETTTESLSESETKAANGKKSKAKGGFSYKNSVGRHDLSFVSGSGTDFQPIGGSLSAPSGFINTENLQKPTSYIANGLVPVVPVLPTAQTYQPLDYNVVLHSYLPQSNNDANFGYTIDTI